MSTFSPARKGTLIGALIVYLFPIVLIIQGSAYGFDIVECPNGFGAIDLCGAGGMLELMLGIGLAVALTPLALIMALLLRRIGKKMMHVDYALSTQREKAVLYAGLVGLFIEIVIGAYLGYHYISLSNKEKDYTYRSQQMLVELSNGICAPAEASSVSNTCNMSDADKADPKVMFRFMRNILLSTNRWVLKDFTDMSDNYVGTMELRGEFTFFDNLKGSIIKVSYIQMPYGSAKDPHGFSWSVSSLYDPNGMANNYKSMHPMDTFGTIPQKDGPAFDLTALAGFLMGSGSACDSPETYRFGPLTGRICPADPEKGNFYAVVHHDSTRCKNNYTYDDMCSEYIAVLSNDPKLCKSNEDCRDAILARLNKAMDISATTSTTAPEGNSDRREFLGITDLGLAK